MNRMVTIQAVLHVLGAACMKTQGRQAGRTLWNARACTGILLGTMLVLSGCQLQNTGTEGGSALESTRTPLKVEPYVPAQTEETKKTAEHGEALENSGEETEMGSLNIKLTREYLGEWEQNKPILRAEGNMIQVLDAGYEPLKEALKQFNETNWQEIQTTYTENLEWAREALAAGSATEYFIFREIDMERADDRVVSFWNDESSYMGGAHGWYYRSGRNFDARTGAALKLSDVATDANAVYELVKKDLKETYTQGELFEDYEKTLEEMFVSSAESGGENVNSLEWVLGQEGLIFTFNPYVLGPWSGGSQVITIPFEGNEGLFSEKYRISGPRTAKRVSQRETVYLDMNGDGEEEPLSFTVESDEETFTSKLSVSRAEKEGKGFTCEGIFTDAYVMDSPSGGHYLYVEFSVENDIRILEVFDLSMKDGGELKHVGTSYDSICGHFLADASGFSLSSRLDILGTYMAYRTYHVGENGMPESNETVYTIFYDGQRDSYKMKTTREIPVTAGEEETVLEAGTEIWPLRTDGETWLEAEEADGREVRIHVEHGESRYTYTIDGISEHDCFESLRYAG